MLHIKHFDLIQHFLSDYTREIHGRALVGKVAQSQKTIALALQELEKEGILTSRKQGTLKLYRLNPKNTEIKDILIQAELLRKIVFLKKHRTLAHLFLKDTRTVGIFGSYASGAEKEKSDIDLFIDCPKRDLELHRYEKGLHRKINITFGDIKRLNKEFLNSVINGVILYGGIEL